MSESSTGRVMGRTDPLRPETLAEFAGQEFLTRELTILLGAAVARGQLSDHILLSGPPGLGKTSLAHIIANELNVKIVVTSGPAMERPANVVDLLSGLSAPSVVFVDEIHRMPRAVEETLYPAMEDGVLDFTVGEGARSRTTRLELMPFTLVGATTQAGLLSGPLRDRFGFLGRLELYNEISLAQIIERSSGLLGLSISEEAALAIALRSRGTPRIANRLLRRVRDVSQLAGRSDINLSGAVDALETFRIDSLGLDPLGRSLLTKLCVQFNGGPVGLSTLAASVGEAPETLMEVYEPFLMNHGLLGRTPRGRVATKTAYEHLGLEPPASAWNGGVAEGQMTLTPPLLSDTEAESVSLSDSPDGVLFPEDE